MSDRLNIDALEDLALEFRAAAQRERAARRLGAFRLRAPRRGLVVVVAALALSGSALAAGGVLTMGDQMPSDRAAFSADQRPLPSTARLAGVQVADPEGGLPWGLRLSHTPAGDPCVSLGRVYGGKVGTVQGGQFRELADFGPQNCTHLTEERPLSLITAHLPNDGAPRTVIHGVASKRIASIDVTLNDSKPVTLTPDRDGAFLLVAVGDPSMSYVVHHRDGTKDLLDPDRPPRLGVR